MPEASSGVNTRELRSYLNVGASTTARSGKYIQRCRPSSFRKSLPHQSPCGDQYAGQISRQCGVTQETSRKARVWLDKMARVAHYQLSQSRVSDKLYATYTTA